MKNYRVNVNGTNYEVSIELIDEKDITKTPAKAAEAPKAQTPAAPAPVASAAASSDGEKVNAPMPGTILAVKVQNGATVKKGDILFVLEAMKMENEILAACDGTIDSVSVTNGATVETGALLCVIK